MADEPVTDGSDWREVPEGTLPTHAQWLQRLLDSPRERQLWFVQNVRAAAEAGEACRQGRHREVIDILRSHSIEKTRTIRRLLSQGQTEAGTTPAPDPETPAQTAS